VSSLFFFVDTPVDFVDVDVLRLDFAIVYKYQISIILSDVLWRGISSV